MKGIKIEESSREAEEERRWRRGGWSETEGERGGGWMERVGAH